MSAESKEIDPLVAGEVLEAEVEGEEDSGEEDEGQDGAALDGASADAATSTKSKKKKSKKEKLKKIIGAGPKDGAAAVASSSKPAAKLTPEGMKELLAMNPSLKAELAGMSSDQATEALKRLDVADLMTGMVRPCMRQADAARAYIC